MAAGSAAVRVVGEEGLELGGDDGRVPKGLLRAIRRCSQGHWWGGGEETARQKEDFWCSLAVRAPYLT